MADTVKPTTPSSLNATASPGQVALSWTGSTDNVGVTGYRIYRNGTQVGSVLGNVTTFTHTGLTSGTYSYTVRAIDAAGNLSDASNTATVTVPDSVKPSIAEQLHGDRGHRPGRAALERLDRQRRRDRLPRLPGRHAGRERRGQRPHLHAHGCGRSAQLHGARDRRRGQPVRPEHHAQRDGAGQHQADGPGQPHGHGRNGPGGAELDRLDRQRRRHGLPHLPCGDAGRHRERHDPHVHPHRRRARHAQLHGAGDRRRGQPVGPEQHGDRHPGGHAGAHACPRTSPRRPRARRA